MSEQEPVVFTASLLYDEPTVSVGDIDDIEARVGASTEDDIAIVVYEGEDPIDRIIVEPETIPGGTPAIGTVFDVEAIGDNDVRLTKNNSRTETMRDRQTTARRAAKTAKANSPDSGLVERLLGL